MHKRPVSRLGGVSFFPRYPVYWHFSDRDLLYDKMGLLGGHSAALGTNSALCARG